jgi:hypothetical protein
MLIVLFDTREEAQSNLNAIAVLWKLDYPEDTLFIMYSEIIEYNGKFGIPIEHNKYFSQEQINSAVDYIPLNEETIEL